MDVAQPGRALRHDIASRSDEAAEAEIQRFISKRSKLLETENQEYREEAAWVESTRRQEACRREQMRSAWSSYHLDQAARHRTTLEALAAHHEGRARELMDREPGGDAA